MFRRFMVTLSRFMYGRYGFDRMSKGLTVLYLILWAVEMLIGIFTDWYTVYYLLHLVMTALIVWVLFRMLSRNIEARRRENEKYCAFIDKLRRNKQTSSYNSAPYGSAPYNSAQYNTVYEQPQKPAKPKSDKTYKYVKCKNCGATLRLKRRRGTHTATCPRCHENVKVRSLW